MKWQFSNVMPEITKKNFQMCNMIQKSYQIILQLCALKQYRDSKRVSLYLSTEDEIDTVPILKHIFEAGKEAFVPRYKGKIMEMVKLKSMEDYKTLPLTKWNIKQPSTTEHRENALETGKLCIYHTLCLCICNEYIKSFMI